MNEKTTEEKTNELLINWSKWLITVNSLSAAGCVVALKTASGEAVEKVGFFFFGAIVSFSLSVICSTLFVFLLSKQGLQPENKVTEKHLWLGKLQWVLFVLGLVFVLVWIATLARIL